jgi:hypothetical protein
MGALLLATEWVCPLPPSISLSLYTLFLISHHFLSILQRKSFNLSLILPQVIKTRNQPTNSFSLSFSRHQEQCGAGGLHRRSGSQCHRRLLEPSRELCKGKQSHTPLIIIEFANWRGNYGGSYKRVEAKRADRHTMLRKSIRKVRERR